MNGTASDQDPAVYSGSPKRKPVELESCSFAVSGTHSVVQGSVDPDLRFRVLGFRAVHPRAVGFPHDA